jgi:hypothetical protein
MITSLPLHLKELEHRAAVLRAHLRGVRLECEYAEGRA